MRDSGNTVILPTYINRYIQREMFEITFSYSPGKRIRKHKCLSSILCFLSKVSKSMYLIWIYAHLRYTAKTKKKYTGRCISFRCPWSIYKAIMWISLVTLYHLSFVSCAFSGSLHCLWTWGWKAQWRITLGEINSGKCYMTRFVANYQILTWSGPRVSLKRQTLRGWVCLMMRVHDAMETR